MSHYFFRVQYSHCPVNIVQPAPGILKAYTIKCKLESRSKILLITTSSLTLQFWVPKLCYVITISLQSLNRGDETTRNKRLRYSGPSI